VTTAAWVWHHVVLPSWLSLVTALPVLGGYWLLGRGRRVGWLCVMAAQVGLLVIAIATTQYGLLVVVLLIWQAWRNWRRASRKAAAPATQTARAAA